MSDELLSLISRLEAKAIKGALLSDFHMDIGDYLLGSQTIGTKYPKPCKVLTAMTNQNDLFLIHERSVDLGAGPCTRDRGSLPFTNGKHGMRIHVIAIER